MEVLLVLLLVAELRFGTTGTTGDAHHDASAPLHRAVAAARALERHLETHQSLHR